MKEPASGSLASRVALCGISPALNQNDRLLHRVVAGTLVHSLAARRHCDLKTPGLLIKSDRARGSGLSLVGRLEMASPRQVAHGLPGRTKELLLFALSELARQSMTSGAAGRVAGGWVARWVARGPRNGERPRKGPFVCVLRDRDSNPKFDIQSVACCQLHHPGIDPQDTWGHPAERQILCRCPDFAYPSRPSGAKYSVMRSSRPGSSTNRTSSPA